MPRPRSIAALLFVAVISLNTLAADAKREQLGPLAGKVDPKLIPALDALRSGTLSATVASRSLPQALRRAQSTASGKLILNLDVPALTESALNDIAATGAEVLHANPRWNAVCVAASIDSLDALTRVNAICSIHIAYKPTNHAQGIANNQADGSMKSDQARAANGLTGAGQKVGVISDTINRTAAVTAGTVVGAVPNAILKSTKPQNTGDLPAEVQVIDFGPDDGSGTDEGEAMLESIYDIAPGAALAFAGAGDTQTQFADNVLKLRQAGCTVVCDDISFFDEPMFQDGPIAQAITANFAAGIPHFSSAGNDYDNGILATYVPVPGSGSADTGDFPPTGIDFHDWGIGGQTPGFLPIDIQALRSMVVVLQWNQPYQSYGLGAGASVDLDLFVYDSPSPNGTLLGKSIAPQYLANHPGGDPFEIVIIDNTNNAPKRVYLALNHAAGSRLNTVFRIIFADNSRVSFPSPPTGGAGPSLCGHAACAEALACAAIFYADIDSGGGFSQDTMHVNVEGYSSKGGIGAAGLPFFFDASGQPITQKRDKPDIAAPDGGNTSVFGSDINIVINGVTYDTDSLPNFFGTSAAAPNAAAVAALLKERASLSTPAQIKKVLQSTAIDIVATAPLSVAGPDDRSGAGLINAFDAINAVPGITQQPADVMIDPNQNASFTIAAIGSATLTYQWRKNGTDIPGENAPTLTLQSQPISADGTVFTCVVSNDFGAALSKPARLFVNHMPVILSGPTATPPVVKSGDAVQFMIATQTSNGQPLAVTWNFGDGSAPANGDTPVHTYAAQGLYTVTVTATDTDNASVSAQFSEVVYLDSDADGQPDVTPSLDNSFIPEALKRLNNLTPQNLTVTKLPIALNFKALSKDTLQLAGTLPLPANFVPANLSVVAIVGGVGRSFKLDSKGKAKALPDATFTLKFKAKQSAMQTGSFTLKITKGGLQKFLAASGLTSKTVKGEPENIRATIYFNSVLYDTVKSVLYTAKMGVSGKTK